MIKIFRSLVQGCFFILFVLILSGTVTNYTATQLLHAFHFFPTLGHLGWLIYPPVRFAIPILLLLSLLFGRFYCSWVCPVGFIQDIFFKVRNTVRRYKTVFQYCSYSSTFIFGLSLFWVIFSDSWYGLFDHYSNFIRLVSILNTQSSLTLLLSILFMGSISIAVLIHPRFFCLYICPSGAIFRIISKFSPLKIKIIDHCSCCGFCESRCPTLSIKDGTIDSRTCIHCFECLESCPDRGFKLQWKLPFPTLKNKNSQKSISLKRRELLKTLVCFIPAYWLAWNSHKKTPVPQKLLSPIPPGGKSAAMFFKRCTGCGLCISVCPTKVLEQDNKTNLATRLKPFMNFNSSYCSYNCNACLSVCPTNAISYFPLEQKKTIKIANSSINESTCIPYAQHIVCGSCAEHCPTGAISMQERKNIFYPVVKKEFCIGCGICHKVCPTNPKSIQITPLLNHTTAYDPVKSNSKLNKLESYEFPF